MRGQCHANVCDGHHGLGFPFCDRHRAMLDEKHVEAIVEASDPALCYLCSGPPDADYEFVEPVNADIAEAMQRCRRWIELVYLAIAVMGLVEGYGKHDCPEALLDETGFCWGCGVTVKAHRQAEAVMARRAKER